jgi:hypothetical protein
MSHRGNSVTEIDLETMARLAAEQLQSRTVLRVERDLISEAEIATGATGLHIVLAALLCHLRTGVQHAAYAELHESLLGSEPGRIAVAAQIETIDYLETILESSRCGGGNLVSCRVDPSAEEIGARADRNEADTRHHSGARIASIDTMK